MDKKEMGWAGWKTDNEFYLTEQHEATISDALTCLKSDAPFCFLQSEEESYLDYYKEVLIALLKSESEIELMYFDPKFGDDLAVIVNKELEDIDISLVGTSKTDRARKILVVDNESFAKNLDWELIDSLRLELKAANVGAFSIDPRSEHDNPNLETDTALDSFECFTFKKMNKQEKRELTEYISTHQEKDQLSAIVDKILNDKPKKQRKDGSDGDEDKKGVMRRLGELFSRN